ncbi:MAG: IMP dehydrogenase [Deltaproteobacteria bacterium]|nr:IMP dehydrogenase [Deltaproteobacteria bacterium]
MDKFIETLTFDDVLLVPGSSEILPSETNLRTKLTRNLSLNIPIISAAMDTVTEAKTAIVMAQEGGIGILHRNLSQVAQAREIEKVKKSESGMILDPITVRPDHKVGEALKIMEEYKISGLPVTQDGKLVGILTNRDLRFETHMDLKISDLMTSKNLVTAPEGTSLEKAQKILHKHRIEKLLVVNEKGELKGLITIKDIEKRIKYPLANKDKLGRLMVGAAIGVTGDYLERLERLADASVDVVVIDTAHGDSKKVFEAVKAAKKRYPELELVAGNIATGEGAKHLIDLGVDAVKVGMGCGSICTTRIISGVGMPQMTAILNTAKVCKEAGVPLIADGGIKQSGDITKALAAGAQSVMLGNMLAGTDESPGETIFFQGRTYKVYRGMGSLGAMQSTFSRDRYGHDGENYSSTKLVPEGIEGRIPYRGNLGAVLHQLLGGIRSGMGYVGCSTISELQEKARFTRITAHGSTESHAHDVTITKEAPNYRLQ